MFNEIRSEWVRLARPRLLLGWFGLMTLFAIMINTVMFSTAGDGTAMPPGAPGAAFPDLATLAGPDGVTAGLAAASSMFGVVTLTFWAIAVATDYSSGLVRILVAAQPHRWRLLAGKTAALVALTAAATTVALIVNVMVAYPTAKFGGISTAEWGTGIFGTIGSAWLNGFATLCIWGAVGLLLAVVTRSSAIAISIGVGYVLVVESIIKLAAPDDSDWLPGSTLTALANGGNDSLSYGAALGWGAIYFVVAFAVATTVITRRDVTD